MRTTLVRVLTAGALAAGLLLSGVATADAARPVRLEAGPLTGYRFAGDGTVIGRRSVTFSGPATSTTDRRRLVPGQSGIYLRLTSGALSGYEVLESPVAYIPGRAGDTAYDPQVRVSLGAGRYLAYAFEADGALQGTRSFTLTSAMTATASRRAVIDGRPYVLMTSRPWTGLWMPVTRTRGLTAQKLTCSVPAKPAGGAPSVLRRITTDERKVALTFDMGGRLTPALDILERLIIDRVCATIFPTGDAALTTVGRAAMALIAAHPELFEIGNHTMHHCNLRDGGVGAACPTTPATATRIAQELAEAETVARALTGKTTAPYWRPPYGASSASIRAAAAAAGYPVTVLWAIDTIDWRPVGDGGPTAARIAATVVDGAQGGSVVLMHLGGYHTFEALPSMVLRLRAQPLVPSTISDILD